MSTDIHATHARDYKRRSYYSFIVGRAVIITYGKIPLTSASYLAEIFYWPLSGVGIPVEQPALRRTLSLLQPTGT